METQRKVECKTVQPRTETFDIAYFQEYVATYRERYPDQQNIMFLDMLYGIGICIDSQNFRNADGFDRFLKWLSEPDAKERYKRAVESLVSEESAGKEWQTKIDRAFQIAAFGEEQSDPEENHDEAWLQNRNHGG